MQHCKLAKKFNCSLLLYSLSLTIKIGIPAITEPLVKANYCGLSMRDLWAIISTKYNDQFPELIKLAQIATLIPVSTADCERGLSYRNWNSYRNVN